MVRSGSIEIEVDDERDPDDDATRTRVVNADAVTFALRRDWRINRVGGVVFALLVVAWIYLYLRFVWWLALAGAIALLVAYLLAMPVQDGTVLGTVTRRYEFDWDATDDVEGQFEREMSEYVTHERESFAGLGTRIWRLHVNPDRLVSVEHEAEPLRLSPIVPLAIGVVLGYGVWSLLGIAWLAGLVAVLGLAHAGILYYRGAGKARLEFAFESGRSRTIDVPGEEADRLIEAIRTRSDGNTSGDAADERLLALTGGDVALYVNVDGVTNTRVETGGLNWAAYVLAGVAGLALLGIGVLGEFPLVGLGLAALGALAVLAALYPRDRLHVDTLAGSHAISDEDLTGVVDAFTTRSRGYVRLADGVETRLRTIDYDYHVVTENVVDVAADEESLWLLVLLLAGSVLAGLLGVQRLLVGAGDPRLWIAVLVLAVGAAVELARRIDAAIGPPTIRFAYPNGVTQRFVLAAPDATAARESFAAEAETVSLTDSSPLGRERTRDYNLENVVALESYDYEYPPRHVAATLLLCLPIVLLVGEVVPLFVPVGAVLVAGGLAVARRRGESHTVTTPLERRSLSAGEADAFVDALAEANVRTTAVKGWDGELPIHRAYEAAIVPENVVSVEREDRPCFSVVLVWIGHLAAIAVFVLNPGALKVVAETLLVPIVGTGGSLAVLLVGGLLAVLFSVGTFLEALPENGTLRLELATGEVRTVRMTEEDAEHCVNRL